MQERIPQLCKLLRKEASEVKVKKLMALDCSDRYLMAQQLENAINTLLYIQTVADAKCSVVVEMYEHMGGHVPTVTRTAQPQTVNLR